jgi:hypothetical protein
MDSGAVGTLDPISDHVSVRFFYTQKSFHNVKKNHDLKFWLTAADTNGGYAIAARRLVCQSVLEDILF